MEKEIVFVAEDDPMNLDTISYHLSRSGFEVQSATNGDLAWKILSQTKDDIRVIILDWMMPGMEGIEVLEKLKQEPHLKDIPVIMQTAKSEPEHIVHGIDLGVYQYLSKPFSGDVLAAMVKSASREYQRFEEVIQESEENSYKLHYQAEMELHTYQIIHHFLVDSISCHSYDELIQSFIEAVNRFEFESARTKDEPEENKKLRCSVRVSSQVDVNLCDRGKATGLDAKILQHTIDQGKVVRGGSYVVIPSEAQLSAIMIRNAPSNPDECQKAVEGVSLLLEVFEGKLLHLEHDLHASSDK